MAAHQANQAAVLAALGVVLLPGLQEVLIHQTNHVEAVSHDLRIGEVSSGNCAVGFRHVHDDESDVVSPGECLQIAPQAGFGATEDHVENLVALEIH